ncbi:hypothetical protein [Streptomyces yaizuensis]|uniref:Uncharacterized protein n=1 Tax=Streptomyces yaizuensis TaxID=2989713 RepID=A0AA86J3V0_9ACTN|nr:hypothetical protein [Streptomyces sp. YSPA8]BDT39582.1 hypothetical protein SYYSPA8_37320 [Streptomyces sp. YSPA8]
MHTTSALLADSLPALMPASAFQDGDTFELPFAEGARYKIASTRAHRHPVTGEEITEFRRIEFTAPGSTPALLLAGTPLVPVQMPRTYRLPCLICDTEAPVELDIVRFGIPHQRVCTACAR